MSRIFIAVISSVIIYIALRADILPDLSQLLISGKAGEINPWRVGFIAAAAGFTESFVPNILNLSNRETNKQNQPPKTGTGTADSDQSQDEQ
jgi:hypothetical protein